MSLKDQITEDMKTAMRAKDSERLGTIRLLQAAMKQKEVDERVTLDDVAIVAIVDKLIKQRKDSIAAFEGAGRQDLADKEKAEMAVLQAYLPERMSAEETAAVQAIVAELGAKGPGDMGKVMGVVKTRLAGKADMGQVSAAVKAGAGWDLADATLMPCTVVRPMRKSKTEALTVSPASVPMTDARPPARRACMERPRFAPPTVSNTWSAPRPPVSARTCAGQSASRANAWAAPSANTCSRLMASPDTTMGTAPCMRATCTPNKATPPVPWMSTVCPARKRPVSTSANQAVSPAMGKVLAAAGFSVSGAATAQSASSSTCDASMPGPGAPSGTVVAGRSPSSQPPQKVLSTLSPGRQRVTLSPTANTVPARSDAGVKGNDKAIPMPSRAINRSR
jgi:uncharacterized protein YqeY